MAPRDQGAATWTVFEVPTLFVALTDTALMLWIKFVVVLEDPNVNGISILNCPPTLSEAALKK